METLFEVNNQSEKGEETILTKKFLSPLEGRKIEIYECTVKKLDDTLSIELLKRIENGQYFTR